MGTVSMQEWLRTGLFGPVRLGMMRAQVRELLGPPDDVGGTSCKHRTPTIWKYGDIEFHFGGRAEPLGLICLDHFDLPTGGRAIALDPRVLRGGLPRREVERQLEASGLPYRRDDRPYADNSTRLVVRPCVALTFIERQEPHSSPPGLYAIGCSTRS